VNICTINNNDVTTQQNLILSTYELVTMLKYQYSELEKRIALSMLHDRDYDVVLEGKVIRKWEGPVYNKLGYIVKVSGVEHKEL
jgi:hypothetical protein